MNMETSVILNAEDRVLGRLASLAAKRLLKGEKVTIVNAEKCIVSGKHQVTAQEFRDRISRGDPYHGPFYPKTPDRIVRRVVRGMLPKKPRGKSALKNLMVFISIPKELEGKEFIRPEMEAPNSKFLTLEELVKKL
jgi:large subunit ribosomal protein L13